MDRITSRLTYANVLSTICLFLVLGGGAWAATKLPKNSVGTPQLKKNAVTGAKVKDGSLTGADVNSSTLGQVPSAATAGTAANADHATSADTATRAGAAGTADHATGADHATTADSATRAGDATTLDGLGASAFYPVTGVTRIDAEPAYGGSAATIYAVDGLVLTAACGEGGLAGSTDLSIFASSSAAAARIDSGYIERVNSTVNPIVGEHGLSSTPTEVWSAGASGGGSGGQAVGTLLYGDAERSIQITLESRVRSSHGCQVSGTAAVVG